MSNSTHNPEAGNEPAEPPFWGRKILKNIPLSGALACLDKKILFNVRWQLGQSNLKREEREKIYEKILTLARRDNSLNLQSIRGYFHCRRADGDLLVSDPDGGKGGVSFNFPEQKKPPHLSLTKYFNPEGDIFACFIVTIGKNASKIGQRLFKRNCYADYFFWHGFTVQLAEALAARTHDLIRKELKLKKNAGKRFSFGYSACPELQDQKKLFTLLKPAQIGMRLTQSCQLDPEQSVSAIVIASPQAEYFAC